MINNCSMQEDQKKAFEKIRILYQFRISLIVLFIFWNNEEILVANSVESILLHYYTTLCAENRAK